VNAPLRRLAVVVAALFVVLFASSTYVQFVQADTLRKRPGNVRTLYAEAGRQRGPILVAGDAVAQSVPVDDQYSFQRKYPGGAVYAPITGYYQPVFGTTALERAENDLLSGTSDQLFYRRVQDLLTGATPKGAAVELTINPAAQRAAWKGLGSQRGAVVALDPKTGAVLALVSKPSFDPNTLALHDGTKVSKTAKALEADPDRPLDNRAIAGRQYPPGSVFKLVTSAAALSDGLKPETEVPGPAELKLPGVTKPLPNEFSGPCGPGGKSTLTVALRRSCNTTYAALGMQLGADKLRAQAEKFGFGQDLSIPLKATPSRFPKDPNAPQLAQSAIGQFDVRVTPLQVAMVSAGIANHGVVMQPHLVRAVRSTSSLEVLNQPRAQELSTAVTPEVAAELTRMMVDVVENGTGKNARIDGVTVAGKTGTAQQGNGRPPHAWFTSFAPAEDPKVAVAVVVEDGGELGDETSGGRAAAPIAKAVMEAVLNQ
jgi:peptidoglycan glycosyltransferase